MTNPPACADFVSPCCVDVTYCVAALFFPVPPRRNFIDLSARPQLLDEKDAEDRMAIYTEQLATIGNAHAAGAAGHGTYAAALGPGSAGSLGASLAGRKLASAAMQDLPVTATPQASTDPGDLAFQMAQSTVTPRQRDYVRAPAARSTS